MRTWLLLALVSTTACSSSGVSLLPDSAARRLQLDVVVANGRVALYTNASDLDATGCIGQDAFPAPGTTAAMEDTVTCQSGNAISSCLTKVALKLGGPEVTTPILGGRAMTMLGDVEAAGGGQLVLEGCGGSATIDLPVETVSQPTLIATVDEAAGSITSTWSSSPSAASALIVMNTPVWANAAHVTESPYTFTVGTGLSSDAYRHVAITTFAPPTIAPSSYGPVHIWTGGYTDALLP
jgi:hypothetical protein